MLNPIRRPTLFDVARLFFVGAIWGGAFIFIALALTDFGPISIATWRVSLGAVVLVIIAVMVGQKFPRGLRNWRNVLVVGCLNSAVPFFLISWGQQFISSAETALLMAMGTFFGLVVSHFSSHDERINLSRALGVSIGFIGVLVLVLWDMIESGLGNLGGVIVAALGLGAAEQFSSFIFGAQFQVASVVCMLVLVLIWRQIQQARHRQVVE